MATFSIISRCTYHQHITVKPVLRGHLKIDKTKVLMTNGSLMKVKSISECSPWSILQYFWCVFGVFLSGRLRQVLLYSQMNFFELSVSRVDVVLPESYS